MNKLPDDVLRLIWKKVYKFCINEIQNFLDLRSDQIFIYKHPNALCPENTYFIIDDCDSFSYSYERFLLKGCYQYYEGSRDVHFLTFDKIILHFKHHPTGWHKNSTKIIYDFSDDESD